MMKLTNTEARAALRAHGATVERREDRHGDTRSGWWIDGVWLAPANEPQVALEYAIGNEELTK